MSGPGAKSGARRLLAVQAVAHPGGAEIGFLRLAARLCERGWQVELTTPEAGPLDSAGPPVHRLAVGGLARGAGARAVGAWPRARSLARRFEVVYLNGTVPARLLPALAGGRTVLHVHDMVERVPTHWRLASLTLADSRAVAQRLPGLGARVVGCPVELDVEPSPAPPWPAGGGPVVGFVGRIEPRKGPLDLVHAAPAIRAGAPGARIVIVGDDPYAGDPAYLQAVRRGEGVEQYGWAADAPAVLGHLDVLVAPSRQEPFGTILAEAMAAGTPVVATRVGGLADTVDDGRTGLLVPPGRPDLLAAAVVEVLARRDEMGAAARAWAQRFGADAYADRVEGLLAPLAARRSKDPPR
ncbi:MAG TPA: glycosyltransferase family 4 protein [Solirubrobacteraceae bacterium]|nr:glycosyltransferase family 4 protein [Solirubrobacteraceae bacterium]